MINLDLSTVANSDVDTVVNPDVGTPSKETTLSMVSSDLSTVFEENMRFKDKDLLLEEQQQRKRCCWIRAGRPECSFSNVSPLDWVARFHWKQVASNS